MAVGESSAELWKLDESVASHISLLVSQWDLIADAFGGELFCYAPTQGDESFRCVEHIRATNFATICGIDPVGHEIDIALIAQAYEENRIIEIETSIPGSTRAIRTLVAPVCKQDSEPLAVLGAQRLTHSPQGVAIHERFYRDISDRLITMVTHGNFPYATKFSADSGPRLADGLLRVDAKGFVKGATPNAVSALRRLGFEAPIEGRRLREFGFSPATVERALAATSVSVDEIKSDDGRYAIQMLPIVEDNVTTEAIVLLKRRNVEVLENEQYLANETMIREIHHRIKNNLQVVSSVLSLGKRRLSSPEAMSALDDSARRISSIAAVHELLSKRGLQEINSAEVLAVVVSHLEASILGAHSDIEINLTGNGPIVQERVASALAMICSELVSNAVLHGYSDLACAGKIEVCLSQEGPTCSLTVSHDGQQLPKDFNTARAKGLGMKICESLVQDSLNGNVSLHNLPNAGVRAHVSFALDG